MAWREVGEEPTDETTWPRNQSCPSEGDIRWCEVYYSKWEWEDFEVGTRWWLLFQTGGSLMNEWIDSPEELDALAIVEAEILFVQPKVANGVIWFWLQVRCLQSVPLALTPYRLPLLPVPDLSLLQPNGEPECASDKLFLYLDGSEQFHTTQIYATEESSGQLHFVFYRMGFFDECEIYNWPVT